VALIAFSCSRSERRGLETSPSASSPPFKPADSERCRRILLRAWTSIQPGLEKLRIERTPELKKRYLGELGAPFLTECEGLAPSLKACLERAASPIVAARDCAGDSGTPLPEFPSFAADVRLLDPPALSPEQSKKLASRLVGTWTNRGHDGKTNAVWKFSSSGELEIREFKAREPEVGRYRVSFPAARRMTLEVAPKTTQSVALLLTEDGVFYASRGLGFDPSPISKEGRDAFIARDRDDWIFGEPQRCTVVNMAAASTPAECNFVRDRDREWLTVRWSWGTAERTVRYEPIAGHLLHERLAELGRFERQAGL